MSGNDYIFRYITGKVSRIEEERDGRDAAWIFETLAHHAILVALAKFPKAFVEQKLKIIFAYELDRTFGPSRTRGGEDAPRSVRARIKKRKEKGKA